MTFWQITSLSLYAFLRATVYAWICIQESNNCFTKITIGGVGSFPALSAGWCSTGTLGSCIHLTGLGDGCHQVLIIGVPPAPPADLGLAATGDHCPVLLVPGIQGHRVSKHKRRSKYQEGKCSRANRWKRAIVYWWLCVSKPTCRPPQGSSSRIWRKPHSPAPCQWSILEPKASAGSWSTAWGQYKTRRTRRVL